MRVLLCLLSEQHVPNLLSVHHFQPDRLVLVESEAMRRRCAAGNFLAALELGGRDYGRRCDVEPLEAEDSLEAVRRALRRAYGKYPSAEWVVNVTGGTKPMSIATYEFFKVLTGRLVYTSAARPAEFLDLDGGAKEVCQHHLGIKEFLAGYGFESRKADQKIAEAAQRARDWWACARVIARHAGAAPLLDLTEEQRRRARDKGLELVAGQLRPAGAEVAHSLMESFRLVEQDGFLVGKLDKYAVQFLTGGWLEVFFWGLLARHADPLGLWDVRLGLEVGRRGGSTGNDFDVAFMHNYGLCMIECKSGAQEQDPGGDVLYKVEAVSRQFRALHVKTWLVTTSDNILDPRNGTVKPNIANRAAIYNCTLVLPSQVSELADAPDAVANLRAALFPNLQDT
jgi:hypothetical protein